MNRYERGKTQPRQSLTGSGTTITEIRRHWLTQAMNKYHGRLCRVYLGPVEGIVEGLILVDCDKGYLHLLTRSHSRFVLKTLRSVDDPNCRIISVGECPPVSLKVDTYAPVG